MPSSRLVLALVPLTVGLAGCMTMTRGRSQTIDVQTSPPGARVTIRPVGSDLVSPAKMVLRRKPASTVNLSEGGYGVASAYVVTVSRPGYKDASVPVQSKFTGRTWARNAVWIHPALMCVGVAVDVATGAGYELSPSSIFLKLEPATDGAAK